MERQQFQRFAKDPGALTAGQRDTLRAHGQYCIFDGRRAVAAGHGTLLAMCGKRQKRGGCLACMCLSPFPQASETPLCSCVCYRSCYGVAVAVADTRNWGIVDMLAHDRGVRTEVCVPNEPYALQRSLGHAMNGPRCTLSRAHNIITRSVAKSKGLANSATRTDVRDCCCGQGHVVVEEKSTQRRRRSSSTCGRAKC